LIRALGLRPKRSLGQHFLVDLAAARQIAQIAIEPSANQGQLRVLEVGAGTGVLTAVLAQTGADITAIEIDRGLVRLLRSFDELAGVHIVEEDALNFDYDAFGGDRPWRVTGNLPYNIGTPLLLRWIQMEPGPELLVVMLQKDVAERLAARPATPAYGSLTLAVQYAMQVEPLFSLEPNAFYPPPKVRSTVVRLVRHSGPPVPTTNADFLLQVVRAAFAYRRKTLVNSLRLALNVEPVRSASALSALGLRPEVRGEELDLAQFAAFADAIQR